MQEIEGLILKSTVVLPNTSITVTGEIIGDLSIGENAKVDLYGSVNGNVTNEGGRLRVFGIVGGKIRRKGGNTTVEDGAIILGGID